jgi:2-aminoadipate transaminase
MPTYSFTGGRPSPEDFPVEGLIDATARVLRRRGTDLIAYPHMADLHGELAQVAAARFAHREAPQVPGISLPVENIVVTAGSMTAIDELARFLAGPGDTVLTEELSYMGSLARFRRLGLDIKGIPVHPIDGMDVGLLEDSLRELSAQGIRPKFIYTIASYQNPTGAILTLERRTQLLRLAAEYQVPIIEDDCYGDIHFEPPLPPPTLYALSAGSVPVVYVGSLSKIIGPGLRLGYMCVPPELEGIKEWRIGTRTSGLASLIVAEYLRENLAMHIARHNEVIRAKRDVLLDSLERQLGGLAFWNRPRGGLFCWVKLPEIADLGRLEQLASHAGVEYTPGRAFHYQGENIKYLRLSYPHMSHDDIRDGVSLLAECIRHACD